MILRFCFDCVRPEHNEKWFFYLEKLVNVPSVPRFPQGSTARIGSQLLLRSGLESNEGALSSGNHGLLVKALDLLRPQSVQVT